MSKPRVFTVEFAAEARAEDWLEFVERARVYGVNIIQKTEFAPVVSPSILVEMLSVPGQFPIPLVTRDAAAEYISILEDSDTVGLRESAVIFNALEQHFDKMHEHGPGECRCCLMFKRGSGIEGARMPYAGAPPKTFARFAALSAQEMQAYLYPLRRDRVAIGRKRVDLIRRMGEKLVEDVGYGIDKHKHS